jgi:hypothetical protein
MLLDIAINSYTITIINFIFFSLTGKTQINPLIKTGMKPPLRQVRNSPRTGFARRQNTNNVVLRSTLGEGIGASAEVQSSNIRVAVRVRPFNEREKSTSTR